MHRRPGRGYVLTALMVSVLLTCGGPVSASGILLPRTHDIKASAGEGGTIDPSGTIEVERYTNQTFTIKPDPGYEILDVIVDEESQGPLSSYTFYFVLRKHTIHATFIRRTYTIKADAGVGGTITPQGEVVVDRGTSQSFSIEADPGFQILDVVVDGDSRGPISSYTFNRIESDHSIVASFESVVGVKDLSIPDATMKVGDEVPATITVGDDGGVPYVFVSGTVGGYPLESFTRIDASTYRATFSIVEGGYDYPAPEAIPVSDLVITSGNVVSEPYETPIVQDNDLLDANSPVISSMSVPSVIASVGDTVRLSIFADGSDYSPVSGTMINGIPIGSPQLGLSLIGEGVYELQYVVGADDNDVAPGMLAASVSFRDQAGNQGSTFRDLGPNSLEIYTELPQAGLQGSSPVCQGYEAELQVTLSGRAPWSIDIFDGLTTTTYDYIASPEFNLVVTPLETTLYEVSAVRDVNGKENTDNGSHLVSVVEATDVEITNLATVYSVNDDPVLLEANVPGGIFSGPGVLSETGYFYPSLADTLESPHTIRYTYANDNGCISLDSQIVHVAGDVKAIIIPSDAVCMFADPFDPFVANVPGINGSVLCLDSNYQNVFGLVDHGDNTATIDPDFLVAGDYTIEFQYFDLEIRYLRNEFMVESIDAPLILGMDEVSFCQDASPIVLQSDNPDAVFEGPGVSGNLADGFTFDPAGTGYGDVLITCTAYSEHGCWASSEANLTVHFTPEVLFDVNTVCLPDGGEMASFGNQTAQPALVDSWEWDFGDPGSGENNYSTLVNPKHVYLEPGLRTIHLKAVTAAGCTDTFSMETLIDSRPRVDFSWISDCLFPGEGVKFLNRSEQGSSEVDTLIWTFMSTGGDVLGEMGTSSPYDTISFLFAEADTFSVDLFVMNKGACVSNLTRDLILRPGVEMGPMGYTENFDESPGMWQVLSEDQVESWVWGTPDFSGYQGDAGDLAWYTRLPSKDSGYSENSWIQSPCYDLSGMERPMIRMDTMRSFMPYLDGAVLQYMDVVGEGVHTLGAGNPGIEWYNMNFVVNKPGGSNVGWGSERFEPDTAWVTAIHDLDELRGTTNVSFRIALASDGRLEVGNQGFALNDFQVAERTKYAVLEHFTNCSDATSMLADDIIDAVSKGRRGELIDLQYHMDYPGFDWMNMNNPGPASTRSLNLGVSQVPYSVVDGGFDNGHRYSYAELYADLLASDLTLNSLRIPEFDIDIETTWGANSLEVSTTVSCLEESYEENIQLYVVVFEKLVTAYTGDNGDTEFRNVVLDILPTPGGKLLGNGWYEGKSDTRSYTWTYPSYVEDLEELALAAFIQDRGNFSIIQAAVDHKNELVSVKGQPAYLSNLEVYPNPADGYTYVNLGARGEWESIIELLDMNGKVVHSEHVPPGTKLVRIELGHLSTGMYFLRHEERGRLSGVAKLVKYR